MESESPCNHRPRDYRAGIASGGFRGVGATVCTCPSDVKADGFRDGIDVAGFVATGVNCACADVNNIPGLDPGGVTVFVADLLAGTACP